MKYMGISITSQNKKNSIRSRDMNTPSTPASDHNKLASKKPLRTTMSVHDALIAMAPRTSVSNTINKLMPSNANSILIPNAGIQSALKCINHDEGSLATGACNCVMSGMPDKQTSRYNKSTRTTPMATFRGIVSLMRSDNIDNKPPTRSMTIRLIITIRESPLKD